MFARDLSISIATAHSARARGLIENEKSKHLLLKVRCVLGCNTYDMAVDLLVLMWRWTWGVSWQDVAIICLVNSMDVPMRILDTMFLLDE